MNKTATRKTKQRQRAQRRTQSRVTARYPPHTTPHHHYWTVATDPTKRRSNSRRGSNHDDGVSRRICLEHPGMFFFSHINLTNGYLNTRLHVRPKRWPSPPPRLV